MWSGVSQRIFNLDIRPLTIKQKEKNIDHITLKLRNSVDQKTPMKT